MRNKRIFLSLISVLFVCCFVFSSCSIEKSELPASSAEATSSGADYTPIIQNYGYSALISDKQREFYNRMEEDTSKIADNADSTGKYPIEIMYVSSPSFTEADIRIVLEAFLMDNPQIFWVDNSFSYSTQNGVTSVQLYSPIDNETKNEYSSRLESVMNSLISAMPKGLSEFDRELYLHDYLIKICEYNKDVSSSYDNWIPFTIYGAMVNGNAVCEGYAKAMEYMLARVGIHCVTVNGYGKETLHKWNIVNIEGLWYHLDATWDDISTVTYDFFNVDDETISYDHTKSDNFSNLSIEDICGDTKNPYAAMFNLDVPECSSMKYNYYNQKASLLKDYSSENDSEISKALAKAADSKKSAFYIKVEDSINYKDALNDLFYRYPYKYSDYVSGANKLISGTKLASDVSFIQKERFSVIELILKYE